MTQGFDFQLGLQDPAADLRRHRPRRPRHRLGRDRRRADHRPLRRGLHAVHPGRAQVRRRARRAHRRTADPAAGSARQVPAGRLGDRRMDWHAIFSQSLQQGLGPVAAVLLPRRHRPQRALRLHRPAQLRPGRLHGGRRLRASRPSSRPGACRSGSASLVGLLAAVVLALLLGVPTLRLRADYLAIVTIAAAEIIRQTIGSVTLLKYFGGQDGLQGVHRAASPSLNPFHRPDRHPRRGAPGGRTTSGSLLVCWISWSRSAA